MMSVKKHITTKNIIIAVTFCLILVSGILTKQNPLFMIPLFVSLGVMALQADVNRTAYLIGGINAGIQRTFFADRCRGKYRCYPDESCGICHYGQCLLGVFVRS